MTEFEFVMWLKGFLDLANPATIPRAQLDIIKQRLAMVGKPSISGGSQQPSIIYGSGSGSTFIPCTTTHASGGSNGSTVSQ